MLENYIKFMKFGDVYWIEDQETVEKLKDVTLGGGPEFWGEKDNISVFHCSGRGANNKQARLGLTLCDEGFLVKHKYTYTEKSPQSAFSGDSAEVIEGWGQKHFARYRIAREDAWRAIEHFIRTGDPSPDIAWEAESLPEGETEQGVPMEHHKIAFTDSEGQETPLLTPDEIAELKDSVLNEGDDFWEGVTGGCVVHYQKREDDPYGYAALQLIGREEFGFIITHHDAGEGSGYLTALGPERSTETVTAELGGQPHWHYKTYCLPREKAWEAIEHFIQTGDRHTAFEWEVEEKDDSWDA